MTDVTNEEVILTIVIPSGKEYSSPFVFAQVEVDHFAISGGASWLEAEALAVEGFVNHYVTDDVFPGDIPLVRM